MIVTWLITALCGIGTFTIAFLLSPSAIETAARLRPDMDPRLLALSYFLLSVASALGCAMFVGGVILS